MNSTEFGPHPFETLLRADGLCTICGLRSVDSRGDLHMFSNDLGTRERTRQEIEDLRTKYRHPQQEQEGK